MRAIGNDLHMDYSAVGQTTHLAARMEQLAAPGSILLTAATLRLVEGLVQVTALGPVPVKGLAEPVEVFELVGASSPAAALAGRRRAGADALCRAAARAGGAAAGPGTGRGRPGPGRRPAWGRPAWASRAWSTSSSTRTAPRAGCVLESASVSYGKATPYFPVIDLLKRYCHIEDRDDPRTVRAKVTGQLLTLDEALQDTVPAAAGAAGRPARRTARSWHAGPAAAPPAHPRRRSNACCCAKARCSPCSWSSKTCTGSTPRRRPCSTAWSRACRRPGCCCWSTTARSTSTAGAARPTTRNCGSTRCRRRAPTRSSQALLGDDPSLAPLTQLLIARTEGNPFFLEESVRTLVETGVLVGEPGAYRLAQAASDALQVPATVQAVLAARIDRLPPEEKRLLQTAAVIGTEVPLPLLQAIAEMPEARPAPRPGAPAGGGVPLRDPPLSRARLHLQARPHARGGLRQPPAGAAAGAACPHCRGPGGTRARPGGRAGRTPGAPCPAGRGVGQGPGLLPAGGGEGPGAVGPPRGRGVLRAGARRPPASAGDSATRASRPSISGSPCARRSCRSATLRRILMLREAEALAVALDDPRRLGQVSLYLSAPFCLMGAYDQAIAAGQRALALATASGDGVHAGAGEPLPSASAYQARATIVGRSTCSGRRWRRSRARRHAALGSGHPARGVLRASSPCAMPSWGRSRRAGPGEAGLRIAEAVAHPQSDVCLAGRGLLALRQGDLPRALPCSNGPWASVQDADLPGLFPLDVARPWARRIPWPARRRRHAAAHAGAGSRRWRREDESIRALWSLSLGEAQLLAGQPGGGARPRRARSRFARSTRNVATRPMPCVSSATLQRGARLRMPSRPSPLPPGPRPGRGAGHAPAPGPLPPRPGHAVCHRPGQQEQARAELSTAIEMYRGHGDDLLAPGDRGGAGAGGRAITVGSAI